MDVAAHLEGAAFGKGLINVLARGLLLGIEQTVDIDLMDETVLIGEGEGFVAIDGHFGGTKGATLLRHGVGGVGGHGRAGQEKEGEKQLPHRHSPSLFGRNDPTLTILPGDPG